MFDPGSAAIFFGALAGLAGFLALRDLALEAPGLLPWVGRALEPLVRAGRAGYMPTRPEIRRLILTLAAIAVAVGWLLFGLAGALPILAIVPLASRRLIERRRRRYRRRLDAAIPAAARAIADALAAGRSLRAALIDLAAAIDGVAGAEFAVLAADLDLGAPTDVAIDRLRRRHPSPRTETFCAALLAGRDSGTDLAGLLRRYADAADAKDRADRDARSATAQARFTGLLVAGMPIGGALLGELVQGGLLASLLRSPAALALVAAALGMQACGFVAIRRLARAAP